eukprot:scaffold50025_cov32-Prasinocladus_malaysianus.AAC.1
MNHAIALALLLVTVSGADAQLSGAAGTPISSPVGSFTPSVSVADQVSVSATVADVKGHINSDNFDAAETSYYDNTYLSVSLKSSFYGPLILMGPATADVRTYIWRSPRDEEMLVLFHRASARARG